MTVLSASPGSSSGCTSTTTTTTTALPYFTSTTTATTPTCCAAESFRSRCWWWWWCSGYRRLNGSINSCRSVWPNCGAETISLFCSLSGRFGWIVFRGGWLPVYAAAPLAVAGSSWIVGRPCASLLVISVCVSLIFFPLLACFSARNN